VMHGSGRLMSSGLSEAGGVRARFDDVAMTGLHTGRGRIADQPRARCPMAALLTIWAIRTARVSSRAAQTIHHSICLRALGGKLSQLLRLCGSRSSAACKSDGSSRSSTWSRIVHQPVDFAAAMAPRPAAVIRPRASISAARSRLSRVQELLRLRGVNSCKLRSSSKTVLVESIQPKQMASSTA